MADSTWWWLLAGGAVAVELLTGTFYLLMLAIGFAAGALVAHAGGGVNAQVLAMAVVASATVGAWHFYRRSRGTDAPAQANRDVNLDIGETVQVDTWNADGTASVRYRGASWTARSADATWTAGAHRVRSVEGNRLILEKI